MSLQQRDDAVLGRAGGTVERMTTACGLLFDPADPEAMWSAIARLLADPELRKRLGSAARQAILQNDYTWGGNARRITAWAQADLRPER